MSEERNRTQISPAPIAFLLFASIVGLGLVPVMIEQSSFKQLQLPIEHYMVGGLYATLCLLGIGAIFFPRKCSGFSQRAQQPLPQIDSSYVEIRIKGHHPDCRGFSGNRIVVKRRVLCAACGGLFVGAIITLVGTIFQFFVGVNMMPDNIWVVVIGEVCMLLGLAQISLSGFVKTIANAVFVFGSFIFLMGVDVLGENVLFDLYALGLIGLLLLLRILLSEWNNRRICHTCGLCFQ